MNFYIYGCYNLFRVGIRKFMFKAYNNENKYEIVDEQLYLLV